MEPLGADSDAGSDAAPFEWSDSGEWTDACARTDGGDYALDAALPDYESDAGEAVDGEIVPEDAGIDSGAETDGG